MNSALFNFAKNLAEENIFSSSDFTSTTFTFIFYAVYMIFILAISAVGFILLGIGLSRMLKKVGYEKPWLAWIPIANGYAIGVLADKYDDGKPRSNFAKEILSTEITTLVVTLVMLVVALPIMLVGTAMNISGLVSIGGIIFLGLYIADLVLSIKLTIKILICYWRVFRIFHPELSVVYLMLSIFASAIASSIVFLIISNREPQNLRSDEDETNIPGDFGNIGPQNPYFYE